MYMNLVQVVHVQYIVKWFGKTTKFEYNHFQPFTYAQSKCFFYLLFCHYSVIILPMAILGCNVKNKFCL